MLGASGAQRLDDRIDESFDKFSPMRGGHKNDYYGLLFFETVLGVSPEIAIDHIAFGGNDFGIDGFYADRDDQQFRLFQFKNTSSPAQLRGSMESIARVAIPALFADSRSVADTQPIVDNARRELQSSHSEIGQVFVDFVFRGDPTAAERSQGLASLKAEIEEKAWILEDYFGRPVPLVVRYLSFDEIKPARPSDRFELSIVDLTSHSGPSGIRMHVGFVPLIELHAINDTLRRRFLERNIRFALPHEGYVNSSLMKTFRETLLDKVRSPEAFAFNHGGVTLSAQNVERKDDKLVVRVPRLLNGAQTVSTFKTFFERNEAALRSIGGSDLSKLTILCRVIEGATPDFITQVTINNNRQNPVDPSLLHANDQIQLDIADHLKEIGIYYQRQGNAFASMDLSDRQAEEITDTRPIELVKLAKTFLATDGQLSRLTHIRDVFEDEKQYAETFGEHRLRVDARRIVICYKAQMKLGMLAQHIADRGPRRYAFVTRIRDMVWALLCQAILNDKKVEDNLEKYGTNLSISSEFMNLLSGYAVRDVKRILQRLIESPEYKEKVDEGNYSFIRTKIAFDRSMAIARKELGWRHQRLA